jgi:hypothetical protein
MKKLVLGFTFVLALSMSAMAAEFTGYISDAGCAKKQGAAKVASDGHAGCAQGCIKRGDKAVLVTSDGKVYTIANQDKVTDHAGQKVTVEATADGDNLTVTEVKS